MALSAGLAAAQPPAALDNAGCLRCHDGAKEQPKVKDAGAEERALRPVDPAKYAGGVHAKMQCVACHAEITDSQASHKKTAAAKPDCASCHKSLTDAAQREGTATQRPRLKIVDANIDAYRGSFHAQPDKENPKRPKAYCDQCHDTHSFDVPPLGSDARKGSVWRTGTTAICGQECHSDALDDYRESIHGRTVLDKRDMKGAVCIDCHTSHSITQTASERFKVIITEGCGDCHKENLASYRGSYHGQVNRLGYGYTAKCHDCHGSHSIVEVKDANSKVHPDNRLGTCRTCHSGKKDIKEATAGFVSFAPHANAHDFARYPQVWATARFMWALLAGVFLFFWTHSALWYYRELKDRAERRARPHVQSDELPQEAIGKQVRRFGPLWRLAHIVFAISVMLLVLTGMTVFYADTAWAPVVVKLLGGPQVSAILHRVAAATMLGIFFIHLVYMALHLWRIRKTFRWFGPDSLVPSWQDLKDIIGMFKWFFGKAPKPLFDRWTYWERFDYWAVFWGMAIIGGSGLMLAFPTATAAVLPGWVLNVAMMVHGEEAFLAAVFLFTVHFFNNHFRPEKLPPPDVVMFTGSVALEEFRREHPLQYRRLLASGELQRYLVDAPSAPMTAGSRLLGLVLIAAGLTLLVLVVIGFVAS